MKYCYTAQILDGGNGRDTEIKNNPVKDSILYKLKNKFNIKSTIYCPEWKAVKVN